MSYPPFERALIERSVSDNFDEALTEWDFVAGYREKTNCICGKDITRVALYRNVRNNNEAEIGCDCVKHFNEVLGTDDPFDFSIFDVLDGSRRLVYTDLEDLVKMKLIQPFKLEDRSELAKWIATYKAAFSLKLKVRKPPIATEHDRLKLLKRLYNEKVITEREGEFLFSVWACNYWGRRTPKQTKWMNDILNRVWKQLLCD